MSFIGTKRWSKRDPQLAVAVAVAVTVAVAVALGAHCMHNSLDRVRGGGLFTYQPFDVRII